MARVILGDDPSSRYRVARDGRTWRIGTQAQVAWIASGTSVSRTITAGIPPVFDAYATVVLPAGDEDRDRHDLAMSALLTEQSPDQRWWLGGSADLVRSLLAHPDLEARSVDPGQDATPPGHRAF